MFAGQSIFARTVCRAAAPVPVVRWPLWRRALGGLAVMAAASAGADETVTPRGPSATRLELGRETTVIVDPLTSSGFPDYLAHLNRRCGEGVGQEENFWVGAWMAAGNFDWSPPEYIREVERTLGISIGSERRLRTLSETAGLKGEAANAAFEEVYAAGAKPWKREDHPRIHTWLEANAVPLAGIVAAAKRPKAFAPLIGWPRPLLSYVLLPHAQQMREVARMLRARAMRSLGEGDQEAAWGDLLTLYRIAGHLDRSPLLMERYVAVALRAVTQEPLAEWVSHAGLSADEFESRWKELAPFARARPMGEALEAEQMIFAETVLAVASGAVETSELTEVLQGRAPWSEPSTAAERFARDAARIASRLMTANIDVNAALRFGNGVYDDFELALAPRDHRERARQVAAFVRRRDELVAPLQGGTGSLVAEYLLSSREEAQELPAKILLAQPLAYLPQLETSQTSDDARATVLETLFRLQIHRLRTNTVPASLDEIADGQPFPVDPFDAQPLRFRSDERGLTIYSVGRNEKDDGGKTDDDGTAFDDERVILLIP